MCTLWTVDMLAHGVHTAPAPNTFKWLLRLAPEFGMCDENRNYKGAGDAVSTGMPIP